MRQFGHNILFGVLGTLTVAAPAKAVDTSQWKCKLCSFQDKKAGSGTVDAGTVAVTDEAAKFGDITGLSSKGAHLALGGSARLRTDNGRYGSVTGSDLGLESRSLDAQVGAEGRYRLQLGYERIPRHFYQGARTPFVGIGDSLLTLPAGFPGGTTAQMPLDSTLQAINVGYDRSRAEAGLLWILRPTWTTRIGVRRDEQDGTYRMAGSFFSTSSQLVVPRDQVSDQFEASVAHSGRRLHFTAGYSGSLFRNGEESLTWANPFTPVVPGSTSAQFALPPDNQYHQLIASAGFDLLRGVHASSDVAVGRMTQNETYLATTLNPYLGATVPTLPASSLHGLVYTFNSTTRLTAAPTDRLHLGVTYSRDVRDNRTDSLAYPAVSTDMFLGATLRTNQPFGFTNDRVRISADYQTPARIRLSVGADGNYSERTLQEVVNTREWAQWVRASGRVLDILSLSLKYTHGDRNRSTYGTATWVNPPENPLLRKFYLARRTRDSVGLRADIPLGARVNIGLAADWAKDDYTETTLGLLDGRELDISADLSVALTRQTRLHAFGQREHTRTNQAGSQLFSRPDWWARIEEDVDVEGIGIKNLALGGRLELGADYVRVRSSTDVSIDAIVVTQPFPEMFANRDTVKLHAAYRVDRKFSVLGTYGYERYSAADWHYQDLQSATVPNLLVFGDQPPRYRVNVFGLALRYRF